MFTDLCLLFVKGLWTGTSSYHVLPLLFISRSRFGEVLHPLLKRPGSSLDYIFNWDIPELCQVGIWCSAVATRLLGLQLSGKAATSNHRAQQNSLGSCPARSRSKFPLVLWISVNSTAKRNSVQVAAPHLASGTSRNFSFFVQPPEIPNQIQTKICMRARFLWRVSAL